MSSVAMQQPDQLTAMVSDLFNAKCDGPCSHGTINEFLSCAVRHHEAKTKGQLEGLDYGDMTYVFTSSKAPNLALVVSYNDAFLDEFKGICDRYNNGLQRASHLAPRVVAQKIFMSNSYDPNAPRKERTTLRKPSGSALLITDFKRLDVAAIRRAGITITQTMAKEPCDGIPMTEGYKAAKEDKFYEVLAQRLTSSAESNLKAYSRMVVEKLMGRQPSLVAA